MKKRCATSWPPASRKQRRALTLVEALAGTALLGTLLASVLIANARLTAQSRHAQQTIDACRLADMLLEDVWQGQGQGRNQAKTRNSDNETTKVPDVL